MQYFIEPTVITIATGLLRRECRPPYCRPPDMGPSVNDVGCHKTGERMLDLACQGFIIGAAHGYSGFSFIQRDVMSIDNREV